MEVNQPGDGGSGGVPGGSNTQVQFNDNDTFGGDAGFTYNKTNNSTTLTTSDGSLSIGGGVFPSRVAATDDAAIRMFAGGTYPLGLITEVNGSVLSFVNNVPQTGSTDNSKIGSIFRLDNRGGSVLPMFSVLRYPVGSTDINDALYDFVISDVGYLGMGLSAPIGKLEVVGPDTSVVPTFLLRQSNNNAFGYDWDLENNVTGRLDQYVVNNAVRTQYMSVLRTAGQVGFSIIPSGNGQLQVKSGGAATQFSKVGGCIADFYTNAGNVGTGEDDLYSTTLAAGILTNNGDKITATYAGIFSGAAASTQELRLYFGGTKIYDSGALAIGVATNNWTVNVTCIRVSSSVVRCTVSLSTDFGTLFPYSTYTEVTGLTLTNTQVLKITGEAAGVGAGDNQVVAKLGTVSWLSAQ